MRRMGFLHERAADRAVKAGLANLKKQGLEDVAGVALQLCKPHTDIAIDIMTQGAYPAVVERLYESIVGVHDPRTVIAALIMLESAMRAELIRSVFTQMSTREIDAEFSRGLRRLNSLMTNAKTDGGSCAPIEPRNATAPMGSDRLATMDSPRTDDLTREHLQVYSEAEVNEIVAEHLDEMAEIRSMYAENLSDLRETLSEANRLETKNRVKIVKLEADLRATQERVRNEIANAADLTKRQEDKIEAMEVVFEERIELIETRHCDEIGRLEYQSQCDREVAFDEWREHQEQDRRTVDHGACQAIQDSLAKEVEKLRLFVTALESSYPDDSSSLLTEVRAWVTAKEQPPPVSDLMAALEASLMAAKAKKMNVADVLKVFLVKTSISRFGAQ